VRVAIALLLVVVVVGIAASIVVLRADRRHVAARIVAVADRLDQEADAHPLPRLHPVLAELERAAERALARADDDQADRDRLSQMLQELPIGVVVADELGEVVARNAIADRFADARHGAALVEAALGEMLESALTGQAVEREMELFGPPRQVVNLRALPLGGTERGVVDQGGAVVFIQDLTEIRRVEQVRRDFVANVSHELKTPVGALTVLADALEGEDDPDVKARLVERIGAEAERLAQIVHDLLDLSVIEAAELPARLSQAVAGVIQDAAARIDGVATTADIAIVQDAVDPDLMALCDRRHVVSALFNLLDNAIKYSDPGSKVEIGAARDGDEVRLWVRDHGVGIPAVDRERIFERFYRVDRARHRQTGGTGLGLSIVRHVAEAHGGRVGLESEEGLGSTFSLWLPIGPGDA
jgi:two-component system, OmpR family, sensor histidine kinase SenX3